MMLYFIQEVTGHCGSDRQKFNRFNCRFYSNNKPVAFVCHSPGALKNVKVNGEFLVKGKKTYRFSNAEEAAG
jgi:putative intracellular protease/amidase